MAANQFSDDVLKRVSPRAYKFLNYAGNSPEVFSAMAANGFRGEDLEEGWALLYAARPVIGPASVVDDTQAADARARIDAWDEPNLRRYREAVKRLHPAVEPRLFRGLKPGSGAESIMSVTLFLDRVDQVEDGPDRAVVGTLKQRGLTDAVRTELRELLATAKSVQAPVSLEKLRALHRESLVALKLWFDDWAATAHTAGLNRFHLIHLGLATRKKP